MKAPAHAKARDGRKTLDGYWLENDWDKGADSDVQKWCYGRTGIPFIDANMRELKETGYMSNRGRQNVASFFTRDMGHQDWRLGSEWFESYLLDYDIVSHAQIAHHWRSVLTLRTRRLPIGAIGNTKAAAAQIPAQPVNST